MTRFVLDIACKNRKNIEKFILKTKKELDNFFKIKLRTPYINLIQTRKEFDLISGRKTEKWGVGSVYERTVFIFAPEVFDKVSNHKKTDFWNTLKHEMVHIYYQSITNNYMPVWLNEGLACYLAKQIKKPLQLKRAVNVIAYFKKFDKDIYHLGYNFVKLLIKRFGKEKILKLIKTINFKTTRQNFNKNFKKIYGFELNKKDLIKRLG